ncbi:Sec63 Brl domain-containing protein [Endogone sp. FLAS-F59071]|nr:Sec63 Brl domain-containing protein [Endogone sp. FLAS-F59071]|eukprot:RUS21409.1 Sec63 Brl domain-containing protein [Endogone sp. FLAS-F59071]
MSESQDIAALMTDYEPQAPSNPFTMRSQFPGTFNLKAQRNRTNARKIPAEGQHVFAKPSNPPHETFIESREDMKVVLPARELEIYHTAAEMPRLSEVMRRHATNMRQSVDELSDGVGYPSSFSNRYGVPLQLSSLPDPISQNKRPRLSLTPTDSHIFFNDTSSHYFSPVRETTSYPAIIVDDNHYQWPPFDGRAEEWLANEEAALEPEAPSHVYKNNVGWQHANSGQDTVMNDWGEEDIRGDNSHVPYTSSQNRITTKIARYIPKSERAHTNTLPPLQNAAVMNVPLRSISELPDRYRNLFPYGLFNAVQSQCLDDVGINTSSNSQTIHTDSKSYLFNRFLNQQALNSNVNLVISAPTGSGKTVVMELAMIRSLMQNDQGAKIIYMAPTKALCSERSRDWEHKFRHLGISCKELTGDTDFANINGIKQCDIIVTTPEKWDSITRRWTDHQQLMSLIRLFMIDEVHMLNEKRGATLEAVVSRMKTMKTRLRYLALSATVPNIKDVARWIGDGYANGTFREYSDLDILQMIGRAGRPGFDDSGCAVIMTTTQMRLKYETLVSGSELLESSLHENLVEHLNAEICLGTIQDVQAAIECADKKLEEFGKAMAKYYLKFKTMVQISEMQPHASLRDVLEILTKAEEYSELRFQQGEKQILNTLNKNPNIRFPLKGRATTVADKVFLLIQCNLGSIPLSDPKMGGSMTLESYSIMSQATRIAKCIIDCVVQKKDSISLRYALDLYRSLRAKVWENSPLILRQLEGIGKMILIISLLRKLIGVIIQLMYCFIACDIARLSGPSTAKLLAAASITTFHKLEDTDPGRIELLLQAVARLPKFTMEVTQNKVPSSPTQTELCVTLGLQNTKNATTGKNGMGFWANFRAETSDHVFLDFRRMAFKVQLMNPTQRINCFVQNEDYIGLDVQKEIVPDVDPKSFISICRPAASNADNRVISDYKDKMNTNMNTDARAPPSPNYDELFGDMPIDIIEDESPHSPPPIDMNISHDRLATGKTRYLPQSPVHRVSSRMDDKENNLPNEESTSAVLLPTGREMCNHKCKNREKCAHECCKIGRRHPSKQKNYTESDKVNQTIADVARSILTTPEANCGGEFGNHAARDYQTPELSIHVPSDDTDPDFEPALYPHSSKNSEMTLNRTPFGSQRSCVTTAQPLYEPEHNFSDTEERLMDPRKSRRLMMSQRETGYQEVDQSQLPSKPTKNKAPFPDYQLSVLDNTDDEESFTYDLSADFEDDHLYGKTSTTKPPIAVGEEDSGSSEAKLTALSDTAFSVAKECPRVQKTMRRDEDNVVADESERLPLALSNRSQTSQLSKASFPQSPVSSNLVIQDNHKKKMPRKWELLPSPPATDRRKTEYGVEGLWDAFYESIPTNLLCSFASTSGLESSSNLPKSSLTAASTSQVPTSPTHISTAISSEIEEEGLDLLDWLDECTVVDGSKAELGTIRQSDGCKNSPHSILQTIKPTVKQTAAIDDVSFTNNSQPQDNGGDFPVYLGIL